MVFTLKAIGDELGLVTARLRFTSWVRGPAMTEAEGEASHRVSQPVNDAKPASPDHNSTLGQVRPTLEAKLS